MSTKQLTGAVPPGHFFSGIDRPRAREKRTDDKDRATAFGSASFPAPPVPPGIGARRMSTLPHENFLPRSQECASLSLFAVQSS